MEMGTEHSGGSWMPRRSRGMVAATALGLAVAGGYAVLGALALTMPQVGNLLPRVSSAVSAYVASLPDPPLHRARPVHRSRHQPAQLVAAIAGEPIVPAVPVARITTPAVGAGPPAARHVAVLHRRAKGHGHPQPVRRFHPRHHGHRRGHERRWHHEQRRHHRVRERRRHHEYAQRHGRHRDRPSHGVRRHEHRHDGARVNRGRHHRHHRL